MNKVVSLDTTSCFFVLAGDTIGLQHRDLWRK